MVVGGECLLLFVLFIEVVFDVGDGFLMVVLEEVFDFLLLVVFGIEFGVIFLEVVVMVVVDVEIGVEVVVVVGVEIEGELRSIVLVRKLV